MLNRISQRMSQFGLLLLLILMVSGCATTGTDGRSSDPAAHSSANQTYMWKVEQAAKRQMVDVVWVNPPRKARKDND